MREILFRGKRVDNGEWVFGGYVTGLNRHYISESIIIMEREISNEDEEGEVGFEPIFEDGLKLGMFHLVIPETIGQFTGLLDKNGKKIFENDIFTLGDKRIKYRVIYSNGGFLGNQLGNKSSVGINDYWQNSIEIIGNIHE